MSHSEIILKRLHDQYLRELDCDVILTAADHLEQNASLNLDVSSNKDIVWKDVSCHKVVLRAASSFFDRIFSNKFTFDKTEVDDGVEGLLVSNNTDDRVSLQIIFHKISSHSIQALINFAYTGGTEIETNLLRRMIEDFTIMNLRDVMDKLEARLDEDLVFSNCIPNLIISYTLGKEQKCRKTVLFILKEFFRGFGKNIDCEERWISVNTESSIRDMNSKVITELKKEANETAKFGIAEDIFLLNVLIKLVENNYITGDEETKLLNFLISKKKEKCSLHLENLQLYCHTDDQHLCVKCLTNGHVKHHIESIGTAKYNQLNPYWEKMDLELEDVKESAQIRLTEIDDMSNLFVREKLRDLEILKNCKAIKPKLDRLSQVFGSGDLDSNDTDVLAFEQFIALLKKESKRTKGDYEKAKRIAEDLMTVMQKRCASCASIMDASLEVETLEDFEEIDPDQPLNTKNCISIMKRSKKINNQQLYEKAFSFLLENFTDVVRQSGDSFYRRISPSMFESLLKSDKLKVKSEDDVILIVKKWLEFDYRQRKRYSTQILKEIRFVSVSEKMLKEIQSDLSHFLMVNDESRELLQNALNGTSDQNFRDSAVKIIAFGDRGQNVSFDSNTWKEWKGQNNGIFFGAVLVGGNIFIMGGFNGERVSKVSIYNVKTKTWKRGPNMLEARGVFGACVSSTNTIYVAGGSSRNDMNAVEMLNCDQTGEPIGDWQRLPPMKTARSYFEVAIVDDKVYAIGGYPDIVTMEVFDPKATMEVFDPKVNRWADCKSMSQGEYGHAVSTCNGEIYVFGDNGFCEKYNPLTDTWTAIEALNTRKILRGSAVLNDKIYLIGGYCCTETCGYCCTETDIYDFKTNTWSKGPPMPKRIGYTKCVLLN